MQLTQKIRIYPTNEQLNVLWALSEKCRLIYNFALSDRITNWKEQQAFAKNERNYVTYTRQQNKLPQIKRKYYQKRQMVHQHYIRGPRTGISR
ncbi:MAG: helix-turn-helix domain-containing protein [Candidatus Lokiarchaeota archaeon]|nr:helix-turn-helix domain-containing protein [Candidatus Lokiarchaeota archaeon]MBD3201296.1 helix-turn-helix domain-containing protein [Candidatus Lokiarchaeota archaeon]